jgi:transcriptional regulator with XRE-family HTH domain
MFTLYLWYLCGIIVDMNRFWQIDGERLRHIRKQRLLTQVELSKMTGVAQDSISSLETGKREAHPGTIKKLAEALDVEPRKLLKEQESND